MTPTARSLVERQGPNQQARRQSEQTTPTSGSQTFALQPVCFEPSLKNMIDFTRLIGTINITYHELALPLQNVIVTILLARTGKNNDGT